MYVVAVIASDAMTVHQALDEVIPLHPVLVASAVSSHPAL